MRHQTLRAAALMAAAALGTHELRYAAAGDGSAATAGHGYLHHLTPLVAGMLFAALVGFAGAFMRARRGAPNLPGAGAARASLVRSWLGHAGALSAAFVLQELLEAALAPGHGGATALLVGGGWTAFLAALILGALVALLMRGADLALARAGTHSRSLLPRGERSLRSPGRLTFHLPAQAPLATHLAGRAPPGLP